MYCFCHATSVDAVPQRVSWRVQLFHSCVMNLIIPVLTPQESNGFTLAPSKLPLFHSFVFRSPLPEYMVLVQSHRFTHLPSSFCHSCLLIQRSHCFLFAFSTVLLLHSCTLERLISSTRLSSSTILQSSRVLSQYSFSFLHLPIFLNIVKILLALIHAHLHIALHS